MAEAAVFVYALSTCPWCRKTKQWLTDNQVAFDFVDVDTLSDDEQDAVVDKVSKLNRGLRFPITVINGEVIVGFSPDKFLGALKIAGGR